MSQHTRSTLPSRFTLSSSAAAVIPLTPLANPHEYGTKQALFTTFPARMRLGTSSLMQPSSSSSSSKDTSNTNGASTQLPVGIITGKRTRANINYAEITGLTEPAAMSPSTRLLSESSSTPSASTLPQQQPQQPDQQAPTLTKQPTAVWGDGKSYLGTLPPGNLVIVQPATMTRHHPFSEDQLEEQAEQQSVFVPIQIDLDVDNFRIRDSFIWNVNENLITPENFAKIFCDDLDIPKSCVSEVARQIKEQCGEQIGVAEIPVRGKDDERSDVEKDLRVILNLDVQIGTIHLRDRIEWDLSSSLTPELFAAVLIRDLSLPSSASPLISHAIHEQLYRSKKDCLQMGLIGEDESGQPRRKAPRPLDGVWRDWNESRDFGPRLEVLSLDEMDKQEAERDRALRRAKRDKMQGNSRNSGRRR